MPAVLSIVGTPAVIPLESGQVMVAGVANFSTNNFAQAGAVFDLSAYCKPLTKISRRFAMHIQQWPFLPTTTW